MREDLQFEGGPFQPDSVLPSQYAARRHRPMGPEVVLAAAVLEDAVECCQKHCDARDRKARRLYEDAVEWIESDDREWPFSYVNICELLELHPDYVRNGIRSWIEGRRRAGGARGEARKGASSFRARCLTTAGKLN